MKILYYSPHPELSIDAPTGYGTHMREMVGAWRRMGVEVKVLIAGDLYKQGGADEVPPKNRFRKWRKLRNLVPKVLWESLKDLRLIRFDQAMEMRLKEAITDFGPDLVYERVAYLQNSGVRVCKALGVRHFSEINAPYPEERRYFSGMSYFLATARDNLRQILIETDAAVTVSSDLGKHLADIVPEVAAKTLVQPNCVNPAEVRHQAEQIERLRTELHLEGALVFGFVGSIFPYHGVDLLIEAYAALPKVPKSRLLVVGDGASLPELRALARKLGVLSEVIFTESVPHRDVYLYIELMDICCMAQSNWYGSPVKIFEYGLLRKPVIAPLVGPVSDVMGKDMAILVQPNAEDLRDAMYLLMGDESMRKRLAENWHHKVLREHTWDVAAKNVLDLCA